ncbi:hypothetical protein ACJJTC_003678 [Scirpophaga incertulas]
MRARVLRLAAEQEERRRRALHAAGERTSTARRSSSTASTSRLVSLVVRLAAEQEERRRRALHAAGERTSTARRSSSTASTSRLVSLVLRLAAEQEERRRRALHAAGERTSTARRSSSTASTSRLVSLDVRLAAEQEERRRRALHAAGERTSTARRSSSTASTSRLVSLDVRLAAEQEERRRRALHAAGERTSTARRSSSTASTSRLVSLDVRLAAEQEERRRRALHAAGERTSTARRSSSTASTSRLVSLVVRLAAEQEERRRRALHAAGERTSTARRSSSTASTSRVRSVRRTSLREKQLAAKADARGEARLRETFDCAVEDELQGLSNGVENDQNATNQQPSEITPKRLSTSSTTSNQSYDSNVEYTVPKHTYSQRAPAQRNGDVIEATENITYNQPKISNPLFGVNAATHYAPGALQAMETVNEQKHYEKSLPNGVRKAPEGQDNEAFRSEDSLDGRKELVVSPNQIAITEGGTATYTTDNNGKINVHVTVMINAGTLADLKKQRAQIRTNGSPVENSLNSTNNHSLNSIPEVTKQDMPVQLNPLSLSPSSGTVPRFSGHTSDVVGDTRSQRCCIIM